jgi:hypothetical protein
MNGQAPTGGGVAMVPFTSAAHEHTELAFDQTVELGANAIQLGPFDVPAYGYMRHILLEVKGTEASTIEALGEDWPWNIFSNIQLNDVNGAPIFGPMDGYATMWCNCVGGYAGRPDPRSMPFYAAEKTPAFILRIPIEVSHRDGFGSLANQNAASSYKVYLTLNSLGNVGTEATKVPLRIRGFLEAWSLPNETDLAGRPQAEAPPMLGSAQFHSYYMRDVAEGANTVLLVRVGSLIRNLIVIARDESGARSDAVFPDPVSLEWDARGMREDTQAMNQELVAASIPELTARDTGVFAYPLDRSTKNTVGDDSPALWYPTSQATRLELRGTNEEGGTLQIITNDVAPVAVQPAERYSEGSRTGKVQRPGVGATGGGQ